MTRVVLFFTKLDIACCTISSESASNDEVASSKRIIGDFFKIALAIDILCFDLQKFSHHFHLQLFQNLLEVYL